MNDIIITIIKIIDSIDQIGRSRIVIGTIDDPKITIALVAIELGTAVVNKFNLETAVMDKAPSVNVVNGTQGG